MKRRSDSGLTLVELLVVSGIGVLVLLIVGGFMISSFQTQQQVTRIAQATTQAQLTVQQLESQLRNSSAIRVVNGDTTASQLLIARVSTGPGVNSWTCEAWYYDSQAGAILRTSYGTDSPWPWGGSLIGSGAWIDLGSGLLGVVDVGGLLGDVVTWLIGGSSTPAEWTVMAAGLTEASGSGGATRPVFELGPTESGSTASRSVTVSFAVESGDSTPVTITTSVSGRQPFAEATPILPLLPLGGAPECYD